MEGICGNFLDPVHFFRFLKGCCHGNQLAKMGQNYLPPLHLSLCHSKKEWDITTSMGALTAQVMPLGSISCKNFVNFGPVTPEKTGLICILFYDMAKNGIFSQISQDIVDRFLQSFHHMKAL